MSKSEKFLNSCFAEIKVELEATGLDQQRAHLIAEAVTKRLQERHAGLKVYIHYGEIPVIQRSIKVFALRKEGMEVRDIARRCGLTRARIYQLLKIYDKCSQGGSGKPSK